VTRPVAKGTVRLCALCVGGGGEGADHPLPWTTPQSDRIGGSGRGEPLKGMIWCSHDSSMAGDVFLCRLKAYPVFCPSKVRLSMLIRTTWPKWVLLVIHARLHGSCPSVTRVNR
jgi:hypothetical protein